MIDITTLDDLSALRESVSLECKPALGHDGKGALPEHFWPAYSAMANAEGSVVSILGLRERKGRFEAVGIDKPEKVHTELFNNLPSPAPPRQPFDTPWPDTLAAVVPTSAAAKGCCCR
ncbi:MAG: hypothetical protein RBR77_16120 [Thauera sp.]|nr:hypothetical protein [Thauera sp.]